MLVVFPLYSRLYVRLSIALRLLRMAISSLLLLLLCKPDIAPVADIFALHIRLSSVLRLPKGAILSLVLSLRLNPDTSTSKSVLASPCGMSIALRLIKEAMLSLFSLLLRKSDSASFHRGFRALNGIIESPTAASQCDIERIITIAT